MRLAGIQTKWRRGQWEEMEDVGRVKVKIECSDISEIDRWSGGEVRVEEDTKDYSFKSVAQRYTVMWKHISNLNPVHQTFTFN